MPKVFFRRPKLTCFLLIGAVATALLVFRPASSQKLLQEAFLKTRSRDVPPAPITAETIVRQERYRESQKKHAVNRIGRAAPSTNSDESDGIAQIERSLIAQGEEILKLGGDKGAIALELFSIAERINPSSPAPSFHSGLFHEETNEAVARESYERAILISSNSSVVGDESIGPAALRGIARLNRASGDLDLAKESYLDAIKLAGELKQYGEVAMSHSKVGHLKVEQDQHEAAIASFESAITLYRKTERWERLAWNHMYLANAYRGVLNKRMLPYNNVLQEDIRFRRDHDLASRSIAFEKAEDNLLIAIDLSEKYGFVDVAASSYRAISWLYYNGTKYEKSLDYTNKFIALMNADGNEQAATYELQRLIVLYELLGRFDDAKDALDSYLQSAISVDANSGDDPYASRGFVYTYMADFFLRRGDVEKAIFNLDLSAAAFAEQGADRSEKVASERSRELRAGLKRAAGKTRLPIPNR